jgi:O-acetylhomoserine (thiol)-lyase
MIDDRLPELATLAVHGGGAELSRASLEQRLAVLEGGSAAVAAAAGPTLLVAAFHPLMQPGGQVLAARQLAPWVFETLANAFPGFGWEARFADIDDLDSFQRAIGPKTQAIFVASAAPSGEVADLAAVAGLAKRAAVPLVVDNTFLTPALCRPLDFAADVVLHTDTRFLCGETSGAGFIVDGGRFNWDVAKRYPAVSGRHAAADQDPAPEAAIGNFAYAEACRAFVGDSVRIDAARIAAGLETLPLRMARHADNARTIGEYLAGHRRVVAVSHAGLAGDRHHALAEKYCPRGAGGMVVFTVEGGEEGSSALSDRLWLIRPRHEARASATGLVRTARPADEGSPGTLTLMVGLEDAADIIADLDQALAA